MIDSTMYFFMSEKVEELKQAGESYWSIGRMTNLSQTTIENIHKKLPKRKPTLDTTYKFLRGIGYSDHEISHMVFGLAPPEERGEYEGILGEICGIAKALSESSQRELLGAAKILNRQEGGDAKNETQDTKVGFG